MADFADTKAVPRKEDITGTATAASSSNLVAVSIGGTVITCNVVRGLTVASGDICLITRTGAKWWVKNVLYSIAPPPAAAEEDRPTPAPKPKPTITTGTLVVSPTETRSYRTALGGWREDNDDVYQGQYGSNGNHTGCIFYGGKPKSIKGSTVTRATIRVKRLSGGDYAARTSTLRKLAQSKKPSGAPTISSSTDGPRLAVNKSDTSFDIPVSWAQDLVDGAIGGLAIYDSSGSPYMRFAGRGAYSSAWTLTIKWRRG